MPDIGLNSIFCCLKMKQASSSENKKILLATRNVTLVSKNKWHKVCFKLAQTAVMYHYCLLYEKFINVLNIIFHYLG